MNNDKETIFNFIDQYFKEKQPILRTDAYLDALMKDQMDLAKTVNKLKEENFAKEQDIDTKIYDLKTDVELVQTSFKDMFKRIDNFLKRTKRTYVFDSDGMFDSIQENIYNLKHYELLREALDKSYKKRDEKLMLEKITTTITKLHRCSTVEHMEDLYEIRCGKTVFDNDNDVWYLYFKKNSELVYIGFCPFCGEKLEQ